jgi:MazG family protein
MTTPFERFCATIAALRHPVTGCPWDLEQTHLSLRRYLIEEAYEAAEAMGEGDTREICDELGDVLLQVVLNAQIAKDARTFTIDDVVNAIDAKMRRRHPHVFGDGSKVSWESIKADEKAAAGKKPATGHFADAAKKHPAAAQSVAIGKLAKKIRFDWDEPKEVFDQLASEVEELRAEFAAGKLDRARVSEELGDVYFSLAQLCRHLDLDPETVALDGNRKFLKRFAVLEGLAEKRGVAVAGAAREVLEGLWKDAKKTEE